MTFIPEIFIAGKFRGFHTAVKYYATITGIILGSITVNCECSMMK